MKKLFYIIIIFTYLDTFAANDTDSLPKTGPVFLLCVRDGGRNTIVQLDREFKVVSGGAEFFPIVIISIQALNNNRLPLNLKNFLNSLYDLYKNDQSAIREIQEIEYINEYNVRLKYKGRKTVFSVYPDRDSLYKADIALGYFDLIKYYPVSFTMNDRFGIIR